MLSIEKVTRFSSRPRHACYSDIRYENICRHSAALHARGLRQPLSACLWFQQGRLLYCWKGNGEHELSGADRSADRSRIIPLVVFGLFLWSSTLVVHLLQSEFLSTLFLGMVSSLAAQLLWMVWNLFTLVPALPG